MRHREKRIESSRNIEAIAKRSNGGIDSKNSWNIEILS